VAYRSLPSPSPTPDGFIALSSVMDDRFPTGPEWMNGIYERNLLILLRSGHSHWTRVIGGCGPVPFARQGELKDGTPWFIRSGR
jgi:hypothetical protein